MSKQINKEYWNKLYESKDTGWDIGYASPPLTAYTDQLKDRDINILVPGCGNGYEVGYLLQQGFSAVTVIDIAPLLTAALEERFDDYNGEALRIITGDFFEHEGQYDLVLEQTFLSALDPSLRPAYVSKMHSLLKPGGKLVGVLFNRQFEESPPFGGDIQEYRQCSAKNSPSAHRSPVIIPSNEEQVPKFSSTW